MNQNRNGQFWGDDWPQNRNGQFWDDDWISSGDDRIPINIPTRRDMEEKAQHIWNQIVFRFRETTKLEFDKKYTVYGDDAIAAIALIRTGTFYPGALTEMYLQEFMGTVVPLKKAEGILLFVASSLNSKIQYHNSNIDAAVRDAEWYLQKYNGFTYEFTTVSDLFTTFRINVTPPPLSSTPYDSHPADEDFFSGSMDRFSAGKAAKKAAEKQFPSIKNNPSSSWNEELDDSSSLGSSYTTYTVLPGDTLWAIASRYLGNGNRYQEIYNLNKNVIGSNPDLLRPGQTLKIPPR